FGVGFGSELGLVGAYFEQELFQQYNPERYGQLCFICLYSGCNGDENSVVIHGH
ncbi:16175_t:CDS:2, partial [Gigaspora rosea]